MWPESWKLRVERTMKVQFSPLLRAVILTAVIVTTIAIICFTIWFQLPTNPPPPCLQPLKPQVPLQAPSRLLPHEYWEHRRLYPENYKQISCSTFPRFDEIHYAAASWQHLLFDNGSIYVYGAYWDERFDEPWVRLLAYCDFKPLPELTCQLWFEDDNAPFNVQAIVTYGWDPRWGGPDDGINEPYIISCRARRHPPDTQWAPAAVSVVRKDQLCGTPTNVFNVQGTSLPDESLPQLKSSTISVCLKSLYFGYDISAELVEWIELIKALGADKIFIFEVKSHPRTRRVLDYYAATGFVDVTAFAHPPQLKSTHADFDDEDFYDFRKDLLPLNDCLYRSINKYYWMIPLDKDEMIVPRRHETWSKTIARETKRFRGVDALGLSNYYFLDGSQWDIAAPPYMKKLSHMWRGRKPNPIGYNVKSFHNTSSVVAMHNHYPISCGDSRSCLTHDFGVSVARLHHYRSHCEKDEKYCVAASHTIEKDDTISKWHYLIKEVDRVLTTLEIKPKVDSWFWT